MLQRKTPKDYVISTGKTYSVKDFIDLVVKYLNLKTRWVGKGINQKLINKKNNKTLLKISKKYFRPAEVNILLGDSESKKRVKMESQN